MGPKALEMVMRDVLCGMEDLALRKCLECHTDVFEIIPVADTDRAATPDPATDERPTAQLIALDSRRSRQE